MEQEWEIFGATPRLIQARRRYAVEGKSIAEAADG